MGEYALCIIGVGGWTCYIESLVHCQGALQALTFSYYSNGYICLK